MVLSKTDLGIARQYAGLVEDSALGDEIFERIEAEHSRTIKVVLAIMETDELLASNLLLARSIRNRFPYIDPLHHFQVHMLREHRAGNDDPKILRGIQLTINGISAGLRNSG